MAQQGRLTTDVTLPGAAFSKLMPMYVMLSAEGVIIGYGPTIGRLLSGRGLGTYLFDIFEVRRPAGVTSVAMLREHEAEKLHLVLRNTARPITFRGIAVALADNAGFLLNLSFGINVVDAASHYALTEADFAPTDLAVEMMYLVESNAAAMTALGNLAARMEDDKVTAEAQALTDTLTGLGNRRALTLVLEAIFRSKAPFAIMHIDLDFFKAVNDSLGHAAGDHVLQAVAQTLQRETRREDTVARVGGDEFIVILPGVTDVMRLKSTASRIIAELSEPHEYDGEACRISASIGIAISTTYQTPTADRMQADADEALYASKRAGRGQALVFHPDGDDRRRA
ncbi:MAG: GGDEF domain-containing protein [bacterium]